MLFAILRHGRPSGRRPRPRAGRGHLRRGRFDLARFPESRTRSPRTVAPTACRSIPSLGRLAAGFLAAPRLLLTRRHRLAGHWGGPFQPPWRRRPVHAVGRRHPTSGGGDGGSLHPGRPCVHEPALWTDPARSCPLRRLLFVSLASGTGWASGGLPLALPPPRAMRRRAGGRSRDGSRSAAAAPPRAPGLGRAGRGAVDGVPVLVFGRRAARVSAVAARASRSRGARPPRPAVPREALLVFTPVVSSRWRPLVGVSRSSDGLRALGLRCRPLDPHGR